MDPHLRLRTSPIARPDAVVQGDRLRITVLTDGLLRLEWADDGVFEDRASTFALHRDLPVPDVRGRRRRGRARDRHGPRAPRLRPRAVHARRAERPGAAATSATTTASGATASPCGTSAARRGRSTTSTAATALEPGHRVARRGRARSTTRGSFVFEDDGWVSPRDGGRHRRLPVRLRPRLRRGAPGVLRRLGPPARAPALGARQLVEPLPPLQRRQLPRAPGPLRAEERLPFSVAVLDMDWHRVDSVPERVRLGLDRLQLGAVAVPRPGGVPRRAAPARPAGHAQRPSGRRRAGVRGRLPRRWPRRSAATPPASEPIAFDVTDRAFLEAYFEVLHHPLEDQGVDFWWLDWQQGPYSRIQGIDPLWMLNHFHFLDSGRDGRRPLTFSRYAGPGQPPLPGRLLRRHRHLVGVAGLPARVHRDRVEHRLRLVEPRRRRPPLRRARRRARDPLGAARRLLADPAAALVEQPVPRQGAVAVPARGARRRWARRCASATGSCPYLHTMNHRAAVEGVPLVRPMYHLAPSEPRAYTVPNQFAFGSELLVAPVTTPRDAVTLRGAVRAWLPAGRCGSTCSPRPSTTAAGRSSCTATSARSRRCCAPAASSRSRPRTTSTRRATPSGSSCSSRRAPTARSRSIEDDGTGTAPEDIPTARTTITWRQAAGELTIGAADGPPGVLPGERTWTVTVLGTGRSETVSGPPDAAAARDRRRRPRAAHAGPRRRAVRRC